MLGLQALEGPFAERGQRPAEGGCEEQGAQHIPLLHPLGGLEHLALPARADEDEGGGAPEEGFGEREQSRRVLGQGVQDCPPADAGEGVGQVQLYPGVLGALRRHRLHRVHQRLRTGGPTGAKLMLSNRLLQRLPVLPHQRARGEFPEDLPAGLGTDPAVVFQEGRQLGQGEEVHSAFGEVPVC